MSEPNPTELVAAHRDALHQLDPARPLGDVPPHRWQRFITAALAFYADDPGWAALAADYGWRWQEIIGADDLAPFARVDRAGLVWFLTDPNEQIEELTDDACVLKYPGDHTLTYYRKRSLDTRAILPPWELKEEERWKPNPDDTQPATEATSSPAATPS